VSLTEPRAVLAAIAAADAHLPGIRCLKLLCVEPDFFAALRDEVLRLCATERPSSVGRPGHVTKWTEPYGDVLQYSLLNRSGRYDDYSSDHALSGLGKWFCDALRYPTLARLVRAFPDAINFRINVLGEGAGLSPHEEHALFETSTGTVGVRARLHLPIATNATSELVLEDEVHALATGVVHYVNQGCVHAARNAGPGPRVHLVWDVLLTEAAFDRLFGEGPTAVPGLGRIPAEGRACRPRARESLGPARRLSASHSPGEVELCEPQ
jgi:Aspartyl/Asparaginyl beta-hydroxylase